MTHVNTKAANPNAELSFPDHWNRADVRGVLYAMQWRVCAYCARLLPGNDRGDVEHFRPKKRVAGDAQHGGYWWLAYKLSNYVLSCGVCNSNRKGNKFPLRRGTRRVSYRRRRQLRSEARLLTDPTRDPLDHWVTVDIEDGLVPVMPRGRLSPVQRSQVEATIELFRINTDRFLIDERITVLDHVTSALVNGEDGRARFMAVRFSPQSLVARAALEQIRPALLPTARVELDWLTDRLLHELDQLLAVLDRYPDDERSQKELDETYWSLAALLKDPLDGDVGRIERICEEHGILDRVRPLAVQL